MHAIHSTTDGIEGFIELEPDNDGGITPTSPPSGKLSLPLTRLASGNPLEDAELRRRVDTKRFPTVDGVLTRMERVDGTNRYRVGGDLAFRGMLRACEDEMSLEVVDDGTVRLEGRSTFDIRDFGMEPPRLLMVRVEPEVAIRVEIIAEREVTS